MENVTQYTQQGTIELRELLAILKRRRKLVFGITALITILSVVLALMKTPQYEAKAILEIGNYKTNTKSNILLDHASKLSQKLNILFMDMQKINKLRYHP